LSKNFITFIVLAIGLLAYLHFSRGSLDNVPPGRHAESVPYQQAIPAGHILRKNGYTLRFTHEFEVKALVLSARHYYFGRESELSRVDLALGWGAMSNPAPLKQLNIRQNGRVYTYRYQNPPPLEPEVIAQYSANMHMIAKNDEIKAELKKIKRGDLVFIKGYLTDVSAPDGWKWRSSKTRNDRGAGACEVVYVKDVQKLSF